MPFTVKIDSNPTQPQVDIIPDASEHNDGIMTAAMVKKLDGIVATVVTAPPIIGVGSIASPITLNVVEVVDGLLLTTNPTVVAQLVPTTPGNFLVLIYYRVVVGATVLTLRLTYNDGSGAQSIDVVPPASSQNTGSYSVIPIYLNVTPAASITLTATAGTANQVSVSATIMGV